MIITEVTIHGVAMVIMIGTTDVTMGGMIAIATSMIVTEIGTTIETTGDLIAIAMMTITLNG